MPTKLTKLYDYREFSEPVDLYEFLNRPATKSRKSTKEMLADMKVLYVVKPNADTKELLGTRKVKVVHGVDYSNT